MEVKNEPVFVMSITGQLVTFLIVVAILLLLALGAFRMGGAGWAAGLFPVLLAMIPLYSIIVYASAPISSGRFYPDHFVLSERGKLLDYSYGAIESVSVTTALLVPQMRLQIRLRGREDPVVVLRNPYSKNLKMDLLAWLRRATANGQA